MWRKGSRISSIGKSRPGTVDIACSREVEDPFFFYFKDAETTTWKSDALDNVNRLPITSHALDSPCRNEKEVGGVECLTFDLRVERSALIDTT